MGYEKAPSLGISSRKTPEMWPLWTTHIKQKSSVNLKSWFERQQSGAAFSKFSEPKRFVWRLNKVQGTYIQEQKPNQFYCYNEKMIFLKNRSESFQIQDWYPNQKMVVVPVSLNGRCYSSECVGVISC